MSPRDPVHPGNGHSSFTDPGFEALELIFVVELGQASMWRRALSPCPGDVDGVGTVRIETRRNVWGDVAFEDC